jgi:hypothetical protein
MALPLSDVHRFSEPDKIVSKNNTQVPAAAPDWVKSSFLLLNSLRSQAMKNVKILVTLSIFFALTACGTVEVAAPEDEQKKKGDTEEESGEEFSVETTTTTTTKVSVNGKNGSSSGEPQVVARYELLNDNRANTTFVGANYCEGSELRDCWVRSGYLTEYDDGSYEASIEFWDSYDAKPYVVEEVDMKDGEERAVLLTDKAKAVDDETISYKMLWAVIIPAEKGVAIVYDWAGDGPNPQGDDLLDALEFHKIEDSAD